VLVVTKTAKVSVLVSVSGVGLGLDPAGLGLGVGLSGLGLVLVSDSLVLKTSLVINQLVTNQYQHTDVSLLVLALKLL